MKRKFEHKLQLSHFSSEIWVFGYGSLIWRPDFPYLERRPAYIKGWVRRFWQGSTDHRGVPGKPGRVVTLHQIADSICWGMAYRLHTGSEHQVLDALDYREKAGYQRHTTKLYFDEAGNHVMGLMYWATKKNNNYLGPAPMKAIAEQIVDSHGQSGPNHEYLLRLSEGLRNMNAHDPHVFTLSDLVQQLLDLKKM